MKSKKKAQIIGVLFCLGATLAIAFQNCSQASSRFEAASSEVAVGDSLNSAPPKPTPTPELLRPIEVSPESKIQFYSIQDGAPSADLYLGEMVHGVVSNVGGEDSWGCATYLHLETQCDDFSKWGKLPNEHWRYVPESRSLSLTMNLDFLFQPNIQFVMKFYDRKNDIRLRFVGVMKPQKQNLVACSWMAFVVGPSNPPKPTSSCTVANAWQTALNTEGLQYTCSCPGVPNPYEKVIQTGRIVGVETYQRAYSYYDLLLGNASRAPAIGGECILGQETEGRANECSGEWFGESPNRYQMCTTWRISCAP